MLYLKIILTIFAVLIGEYSVSQVGIGTTSPNAVLDIRASNQSSPLISDGVLIPAIDDYSTVNPGPSQDGMLIFITGNGSVSKGFYYWDNASSIWIELLAGTRDWITVNGNDVERQSGDVYIGDMAGTNSDLYISNRLIDWDNSTYFIDPGSNSRLNEVEFSDGTAADPSIRFDDLTTGFFSPASDNLAYSINSSEVFRIDASGDVGIGTTNPEYSLEVSGSIMLEDSTSPSSNLGHSGIYSSSGELYTIDSAGNNTVISPHHFSLISKSEAMAWSYFSINSKIGKQINVDMMKAIRFLEKLTGEQLIFLADLEGNSITSTGTNELEQNRIDELLQEIEDVKSKLAGLSLSVDQLIDKNN